MTYDYSQYYKVKSPTGYDIYNKDNQKLSYEQALPMFQSGFNVEFIPAGTAPQATSTPPTPAPVQQTPPASPAPAPITPQTPAPAPAPAQTPVQSTDPSQYFKVETNNIGADGKPIYDIYTKQGQKLSYEQALPLFQTGLNVDFISKGVAPTGQQQAPQQAQTVQTAQTPTSGQNLATGQTGASGSVSEATLPTQMPYVQYAGSPDIFERTTGTYIPAEQAEKLGINNALQVEQMTTPRPDIKTEADFATLARTNLKLQEKGVTVTPEDFQNNPLKAFQDTYSQIWNNLGLTSVKEQIETTLKAMKEIDYEMIDKIAEVNDNPWITEGARAREVNKLQNKYEQKNAVNSGNLKLLQGLYEMGRQEAQFTAQNAMEAYYKQQTFDQQILLKQMDIAEKMSEAMNKKSFRDLVGEDGRMHTYIVNEAGEKLVDLGVSELPKDGGGTAGTPSVSDENGQRITVLDSTSSSYINDLFNSNIGGKKVTQVELLRPLQKALTVSSQLGELSTLVKTTNTDPIIGTLRSMNPYDFDARAIQATLQAIVPNLARGVYGEVGVLTDNDIKNYIQTLPNIKSTEQQNKFVMGMTLRSLQSGLLAQLEVLQAGGYDLSGFRNSYDKMARQANDIEKDLGIGKEAGTQNISQMSNQEFLQSIPTFGPPTPAQTDNKSFFGDIYNWLIGK